MHHERLRAGLRGVRFLLGSLTLSSCHTVNKADETIHSDELTAALEPRALCMGLAGYPGSELLNEPVEIPNPGCRRVLGHKLGAGALVGLGQRLEPAGE